jgi:hypothetical protein
MYWLTVIALEPGTCNGSSSSQHRDSSPHARVFFSDARVATPRSRFPIACVPSLPSLRTPSSTLRVAVSPLHTFFLTLRRCLLTASRDFSHASYLLLLFQTPSTLPTLAFHSSTIVNLILLYRFASNSSHRLRLPPDMLESPSDPSHRLRL